MSPLGTIRDVLRGSRLVPLAIVFFVGFFIGWFLMGYVVWPVQYVGEAQSHELSMPEKKEYVMMVADSYSLTGNAMEARNRFAGWDDEEINTMVAELTTELRNRGRLVEAQRVESLGGAMGIAIGTAPQAPTAEGQSTALTKDKFAPFSIRSVVTICAGLVAIYIVIAAILFVVDLRRRKRDRPTPARPGTEKTPSRGALETELLESAVGHFLSTYTFGDDNYDESFTIETAAGEFLGECGIGISETTDLGPPDRVTAFEVWLFDKSDIRTVTKVLMSEFAFDDPVLRDKLAPKGDAVLAEMGKVFEIQTATLEVQLRIVELEYGDDAQKPNSYFDRMTVELLAKLRDGDQAELE